MDRYLHASRGSRIEGGRLSSRKTRLLVAALVGLGVAACGGGSGAPSGRAAGSAIWVDPGRASLDPDGRRILAEAGVEEVFLEAGTLTWDGARPMLETVPEAFAGAVPEGTPVTLVLRGTEPVGEGLELGGADRGLARAVRELRLEAEAAGLLPLGYHLDLPGGASPALVRHLRDAAGPDLLVSTELSRERLGRSDGSARDPAAARELAAASDFVVAFLYGQRPGERDAPAAWDPQRMEEDLAALESLETDYLVGFVLVGSVHHLTAAGDPRETRTRADLKDLAREPALRLSIADPFAGVGRVVHSFQAQRPVHAAGWDLAPGETVRVVRTAPSLVQDLLERARRAELRHRVGQVFYRLASPDEGLSLTPAEVAAAMGRSPPEPELRPRLVVESMQGDSATLGVSLRNRSPLSTDLAATDGNYVRVRAESGYFDGVEPGEFSRYSLWRGGREVRPGLGWREPDEVRLYTPMVRGGERIGGARLELRRRGAGARVTVGGRFFLPDGRELELAPTGGPVSGRGVVVESSTETAEPPE